MSFESKSGIARRGVHWKTMLVLAGVLGGALVAATGTVGLGMMALVLGIATFSMVTASRIPTRPSKGEHVVVADREGLSIDGDRELTRDQIVRAYCVPADRRGQQYVVHCEGRFLRPACSVWVDSLEEGEKLVAALEIAGSSATAHFRALPPWARHLRWITVALTASPWVLINLLRIFPGWMFAVLGVLYGVILVPTLLPQRVDVGHDGVFLRWLGNRRFIPFSRIAEVTSDRLGVKLLMRAVHREPPLEIRMSQKEGRADAQIQALHKRIAEGLAAHRGMSPVDEEALLARSGRDVETWMREMRALGGGEGGGYRAAAIPRDRLWSVVENVASDPSARKGAALALSASLDEAERARLVALAQTTASPRLRVALDGVGRERDEVKLRVAVEEAEQEREDEVEAGERERARHR